MSTEAELYQIMRRHMPEVCMQRIETSMAEGVPDISCCCDMVDWWMELKVTVGWAVRMRASQVGWITRRARAGGRVRIVVRQHMATGGDSLWVIPGSQVRALADRGLRAMDMLIQTDDRGPHSWDWTAVRLALVSDQL